MKKFLAGVLLIAFIAGFNLYPIKANAEEGTPIPKDMMTAFASSLDYQYSMTETIVTLTDQLISYDGGYYSTSHESQPYIQVDLGGYYEVYNLTLHYTIPNKSDTYSISVSEDGYTWTQKISSFTASSSVGSNTVSLSGAKARSIKIQRLSGSGSRPEFTEITVYGNAVNEVSGGGLICPDKITATASSSAGVLSNEIYSGGSHLGTRYYGAEASFTLDGDLYTSFWQSVFDNSNAWIAFDLSKTYNLENAVLYLKNEPDYAVDIYTSTDGNSWSVSKENYMISAENDAVIDGLAVKKARLDLSDLPDSQYVKFQRKDKNVWTIGEVCFYAEQPSIYYKQLSQAGWKATAYGTSPVYTNRIPDLGINGNTNDWWTSANFQTKGDWYKIDMGSKQYFDKVVVTMNNESMKYGHDADLLISEDDVTYMPVGHYHNKRYRQNIAAFEFDLQCARYIKLVLSNDYPINASWEIVEVAAFNSGEAFRQTGYYQVNGLEQKYMNHLLSGNIQNVKIVSLADITEGVMFSGLYNKNAGEMCGYWTKPFIISNNYEEVSVDAEVSEELTGLPSEEAQQVDMAKTAVASLKSNSGGELGSSAGHIAQYANDDSPDTYARAAGEWAWTLQLEFPEIREIGKTVITFAPDQYPVNYDILLSEDGVVWEKVKSISDNHRSGTFAFEFSTTKAKYLQVRDNLAQTDIRQMAISNIEVFPGYNAGGYELRSFLLSDLSTYIPIGGTLDILGDNYLSADASFGAGEAKECETKIDMHGNLEISLPKVYDKSKPLVVYIAKGEELVYLNMLTSQDVINPALQYKIKGFKLGDVVNISFSGAFSFSKSIPFDGELVFADFVKEYENCAESELDTLFEKYAVYINCAYSTQFDSFSAGNKAIVYKAVLNSTFSSFEGLRNVMNNKIKEIIDKAKDNGNSVGSDYSTGGKTSSDKNSKGRGVSVNQSFDTLEQLVNSDSAGDAFAKTFDDLSDALWAAGSIKELYNRGIIKGTGNGKFSPNSEVTRAEFIKMLVMSFGTVDTSADCPFNDISEKNWEYPYIATAYKLGLANGISGDVFGKENYITRQDAATLLYRFCMFYKTKLNIINYDISFADISEVSGYAWDAVKTMGACGIMSGVGDNRFAPNDFCTRAMAAKVIYGVRYGNLETDGDGVEK